MVGKPPGLPPGERDPLETYVQSVITSRKRRRDAKPGPKPDYHKRKAVLSVRVDDDLAEWARRQAETEGLSMNAWLGNLLENLRSQG